MFNDDKKKKKSTIVENSSGEIVSVQISRGAIRERKKRDGRPTDEHRTAPRNSRGCSTILD